MEMFQLPRTGLSAMSTAAAQTPRVVNTLGQSWIMFPAPSVILTSMAPRHGGLHLGGEHDGAELDRVARLVDGLVRLDEHGVALVLVLEGGGLRP